MERDIDHVEAEWGHAVQRVIDAERQHGQRPVRLRLSRGVRNYRPVDLVDRRRGAVRLAPEIVH